MKLRPYQERLVSAVVDDLSAVADERKEVVLAACPGAGKTLMSIAAIERLLTAENVRRVLVLAHATTLLRDNYISKLREAAPGFDFAEYLPMARPGHVPIGRIKAAVVVALPQTLARLKALPSFDLVVVDEAHLFYGAPMVDSLIERAGAGRVLLLTGTPAPFVARGLPMHVVSMKELYEEGNSDPSGPWVSDVRAAVLQSKHDVRKSQYNADGEIRRAVKFRRSQTTETLDDLRVWLGGKPWPAVFEKIGKTMIVCRSQSIAAQAAAYFNAGDMRPALSTSDADPKSEQVRRFVGDPSALLMIVVRRGDIGFDFPGLGALIDMTGTINIDRVFQMFARTVRPNGDRKKLFLKLASSDMFQYTKSILKASLLLTGRAFYETWNGANLNGVKVPVERAEGEAEPTESGAKPGKRKALPTIDDGFLVFDEFIKTQTREDGALIGGTTMGAVAERLGAKVDNPDEKISQLLSFYREHGRTVPRAHPLYDVQFIYSRPGNPCYRPWFAEMFEKVRRRSGQGSCFIGSVHGKLTVVGATEQRKHGQIEYRCLCAECGSHCLRTRGMLKSKRLLDRSCGCVARAHHAAQMSRRHAADRDRQAQP